MRVSPGIGEGRPSLRAVLSAVPSSALTRVPANRVLQQLLCALGES